MSDLGDVQDPQTPRIKEAEVVSEIRGWFARLCEREIEQAQRGLESCKREDYSGEIPLEYRLRGGLYLDQIEAWTTRLNYANKGQMVIDAASMHNPEYANNRQIRDLQERAQSLGLVEWPEPPSTLGKRF
jgi:hypothetical protein